MLDDNYIDTAPLSNGDIVERAFFEFMSQNGIDCKKIKKYKKRKTPDFLCVDKDCTETLWEIKAFRHSGTTRDIGLGGIIQRINFDVGHFLEDAQKKFSNPFLNDISSALLIVNLRPRIRWEQTFFPDITSYLIDNLAHYPDIGNVVIAGIYHNERQTIIVAMHIFENPKSKKVIDRKFFSYISSKRFYKTAPSTDLRVPYISET